MLSAYLSLRSYSHLSIIFIVLISNSQLLLVPFPRCSRRALFLIEGFIFYIVWILLQNRKILLSGLKHDSGL